MTANKFKIKCGLIGIFIMLMLIHLTVNSQSSQISKAQRQLGERLFRDARFSAPQGDLPANCANCHLFDEDPQGLRPFADFFNRSWISYRTQSPQRFELRNSPALFDVALMPRLHYDGEFTSLEELVIGTFAGRPMGWLPHEREQALSHLQEVILSDGEYPKLINSAYKVEVSRLNRNEIINVVARAVADFMRTLRSRIDSPYDQFIKLNGLDAAAAKGEIAKDFGLRLLKRITLLENEKRLKLPESFGEKALSGLKIFFNPSTGNCVTCHEPPMFTDYSYHNLGISQVEYDLVHGAGAFMQLEIPDAANAKRPEQRFREYPNRQKTGEADLGHWNIIDLKTSPLRRKNENDTQLLRRMIGALKTPGLRHLAYTYPYMHNGAYTSLEDTLMELKRLSEMSRAGLVRSADDELLDVRISEADITPLVTFLNSLNEDLRHNSQQTAR